MILHLMSSNSAVFVVFRNYIFYIVIHLSMGLIGSIAFCVPERNILVFIIDGKLRHLFSPFAKYVIVVL